MIALTPEMKFEQLLNLGVRTENGCLICHHKPNKKGYANFQLGGRGTPFWEGSQIYLVYD
jgi:hypothetical protein